MLSLLFSVTQLMSGKVICEVNLNREKMWQKGWKKKKQALESERTKSVVSFAS